MADAPKTDVRPPAKAPENRFKVADVRSTDVTLQMEDGRVFLATLGEGVTLDDDNAKRNHYAFIEFDGLDRSDAPKDAKVTRFAPRD